MGKASLPAVGKPERADNKDKGKKEYAFSNAEHAYAGAWREIQKL
jgi:hypothetical protein